MALEWLARTIVKAVKEANARAQAEAAQRARLVAAARGGRLAPSMPAPPPPARVAPPSVAAAPADGWDASPFSIDAPGGALPAAEPPRYRRELLADFSAGGLLPAIVLAEALAKPLALRDGADFRL